MVAVVWGVALVWVVQHGGWDDLAVSWSQQYVMRGCVGHGGWEQDAVQNQNNKLKIFQVLFSYLSQNEIFLKIKPNKTKKTTKNKPHNSQKNSHQKRQTRNFPKSNFHHGAVLILKSHMLCWKHISSVTHRRSTLAVSLQKAFTHFKWKLYSKFGKSRA